MSRRVWIVGTVSWDTVIYVDHYPAAGGFAQGKDRIERLGGSAANIAQALATTGIEVHFVSFLGRDELGNQIESQLRQSEIAGLHLHYVTDRTSHAVVVVDKTGERTVFALSKNYMNEINLVDLGIEPTDIVVFPIWRSYFLPQLEFVQGIGCATVVGLGALADPDVKRADLAIGSQSDAEDSDSFKQYLNRFSAIVVTQGVNGSVAFTSAGEHHQPVFPVNAVDATGAGDAYLSGYLTGFANDVSDIQLGMKLGAMWSAAMVERYVSIPPHALEITEMHDIISNLGTNLRS